MIPTEVEAAGMQPELLKVFAKFAHPKPEASRAWMQRAYALSDGARAVYQATGGKRMLRANYPTTLAPGCYCVITGEPLEWPKAFNDFDVLARSISVRAEGPWGFDPYLFEFKDIASALARAEVRVTNDKRPKALARASRHYLLQITLGGELDPMLAKIGPVEILTMPVRL